MDSNTPYRDNLELQTQSQLADHPDSPLPLHNQEMAPLTEPRWMLGHHTGWQNSVLSILPLVRPRATWRYALSTLVVLYLFYCWVADSPLFASRLPQYTGPHGVGTVDIEVPLTKPRNISSTVFKETGQPTFQLESVLFSVFYPAANDAQSKQRRHDWIPKPISMTGAGYARAAHLDNFLMRPILTFGLWLIAGGITIPAEVDVPLLPTTGSDLDEQFPVVIFSHGTASSRTDYTYYCGELASRGVVVVALEHRDGSGPGTQLLARDGTEVRRVIFMRESDLLSDPPMDSTLFKKEQLNFREAEIEAAIRVIGSINAGHGKNVFEKNTRREGQSLHFWQDRLALDSLVIAGHSYGATGALQALKVAPGGKIRAVAGIALDPGKSSGQLNFDIDVPILVVHSNSWSKSHTVFFGRPHFDTVRDLVNGVLDRVGASWFVTSLGTSHPSVTDAPLIEPLLLSWTTGATINVNEGLREYVRVSIEFMKYLKDGTWEGVLSTKVTHPEYDVDARTEEEKRSEPSDVAKYWQIHISPAS